MKTYGMENAEGSEIINLTVPTGTSFPANPNAGELFFRTDSTTLNVHDGSVWGALYDVGDDSNLVHTTGNETMGGSLTIENTQPRIFLLETDAQPDEGNYFLRSTNGNLELISLDDELGGVTTIFKANNVSGVITSLTHNTRVIANPTAEPYAFGVSRSEISNAFYLGASTDASPDLIFSNNAGTEIARMTNAGDFTVDSNSVVTTDSGTQTIAGYKTFTNGPTVQNSAPEIYLNESDAAADERLWGMIANGGGFKLRTRTDAGGAGNNALIVERTGIVIDSVAFPEGNFAFGNTIPLSNQASYTHVRMGGNGMLMANTSESAGSSLII